MPEPDPLTWRSNHAGGCSSVWDNYKSVSIDAMAMHSQWYAKMYSNLYSLHEIEAAPRHQCAGAYLDELHPLLRSEK